MGPSRGIFCLALLLLVLSISTSAAKAAKPTVVESDVATSDTRIDEDDDGFIEKNPGYVSDGGSDSDSGDEYDSDDEDEPLEPKAAMNSALGKQQKKKRDKLPTKVVKFVKTHRFQITIALAVIAFRREIGKFLMNKLAPVDPETGKMRIKVDPTQILKIIVFIDILRQFQAASKNKNNNGQRGADPLLIALLLLGAKNPIFSSLITKTILQENSSFVPPIEQHYTFERINDRYEKDGWALQKAAQHSPNSNKKKQGGGNDALNMLYNLRDREGKKKKKFYDETVIVLDLQRLNDTPGRIDMLRDEVSFLLHQHEQKIIPYNDNLEEEENNEEEDEEDRELEIVVLLESPGGVASDFALASQQLLRLRQAKGIRVTVCVDRVAASGGYMVACASSPGRLYAAPFAVLGSIGVIGQAINVQKLLEGWGIQGMVFKAGKEKAPGGLIGEVTKRDKKSIQSIVDETHTAFKRHVANARPKLARTIEDVATGKIWLGYDALKEGLIDRIVTSDEYIRERINDGARVLKLIKNTRKRLFGGPPQQQGALDSRILSLKTEAKRALQYLAERINIPLGSAGGEDLEGDLSPLTSTRLPHHSAKVDARSSSSPQ